MVQKTVILQFHNEEVLLPLWLKHHIQIFQHGILIDNRSTDNSLDIIRAIAPHWQVVPSTRDDFDAKSIDDDVMLAEERADGWKMAMNVTEYLIADDLDDWLDEVERAGAVGTITTGYCLVDPPWQRFAPVDYGKPLLRQRHHGFPATAKFGLRDRMIHRGRNGQYHLGRHGTSLGPLIYGTGRCHVVWTYWSLMELAMPRRLQVRGRLTEQNRKELWFYPGMATRDQLEAMYAERQAETKNLLEDPVYAKLHSKLPHTYY